MKRNKDKARVAHSSILVDRDTPVAAPDMRGRGSQRLDPARASRRLARTSERKAQRRPPRA
jgi:hypothetical protein